MNKHTAKKWKKVENTLLNGQNTIMGNKTYFRYFVLKTLFHALFLKIKPLKSTMGV